MADQAEQILDPSIAWFVDPARLNAVASTQDGIIVEIDSAGVYNDIPSEEVSTVLEQISLHPWRLAVKELYETRNPWLYRIITDPSRGMPLEILDIKPQSTCLDVGSGWGQLSIPLSQWGCRVVSLDLTVDRLKILRSIARQEGAEPAFAKGNILSFPFAPQIFDLVLFNGVLEWIGTGRERGRTIQECQIDALRSAGRAIKDTGTIYVGIENNLGLKYLMGARDDHTGLPNFSFRSEREAESIMKIAGAERATAKTWGLSQLKRMVSDAGLTIKSAFGCFPDYKVPRHMVPIDEVNDFLRKSEIDWDEHHGDRGEPLADQEAIRSAYRQLAENGIAQWMCPSYLLVIGKS